MNTKNRSLAAAMVALMLTCPARIPAAGSGEDSAWQVLFDGKTVSGWWNPYEWGDVNVEDGEIRLTADRKFFLLTDRTYADFEFEAEIKLPEGKANSGFMFRAHQEPNRVWGYQAEVDPTDRAWSGGLYDEGRRKWLHPAKGDAASEKAFTGKGNPLVRDGWNLYRIRCEGNRITISVNDQVTTEYTDEMDASGYIGLQHHGEDGQTYRFRNIRINELPRKTGAWNPMFHEGSLEGWTTESGEPIEPGGWVMGEGGVLHLAAKGGHLYSQDAHENFELEFEWNVSPGANSGVKYRVDRYGEKGRVIGAEYQVLDDENHPNGKKATTSAASLYDVAAPAESKKLKPAGEWNTARIVADGSRLEHWVNGEKVLETDTASGQWKKQVDGGKFKGIYDFATRKGRILIQDHGDEVWFRGMRVREF